MRGARKAGGLSNSISDGTVMKKINSHIAFNKVINFLFRASVLIFINLIDALEDLTIQYSKLINCPSFSFL